MATVRDVIDAYFAAWNEPDADARAALLVQAWTDDGVLVAPRAGHISGRQALVDYIGALAQRFPGARVLPTSGVDEHHGVLRYTWRITAADGSAIVDGVDFGELAPDGRLQRIAEFDGPLPIGA